MRFSGRGRSVWVFSSFFQFFTQNLGRSGNIFKNNNFLNKHFRSSKISVGRENFLKTFYFLRNIFGRATKLRSVTGGQANNLFCWPYIQTTGPMRVVIRVSTLSIKSLQIWLKYVLIHLKNLCTFKKSQSPFYMCYFLKRLKFGIFI